MTKVQEADAKALAVQQMVFSRIPWGKAVNSFAVDRENWEYTREDGVVVRNDVKYGDTYPNSYLDIWYPDRSRDILRPAIISFHGGGSLFGDKKYGDPLAVKAAGGRQLLDVLLENGYIYVQANYAFAPEYRFPVQLRQVNEAVGFIKRHAVEFGIDKDRFVVAGSSAGACYTELYGLCVADPEYAMKFGFEPSVSFEDVKALIINESALQFDPITTGDDMWVLHTAWFGVEDILTDPVRDLVDVPKHIRDKYPPTFITASNDGPTFKLDADRLSEKLREIGVDCEYYYVPNEVDNLTHGYANNFDHNESARGCVNAALSLLRRTL